MSAARDYEDLLHLVGQLTPDQVREMRAHALRLVRSGDDEHAEPETREEAPTEEPRRRRRLSIAGLMRAEADLAARSEDILRDEFARHSA